MSKKTEIILSSIQKKGKIDIIQASHKYDASVILHAGQPATRTHRNPQNIHAHDFLTLKYFIL